MSTPHLFGLLFDLLAGSTEYMVTGSLSFLPLLPGYREPGEDLDVFIRRDVFESRRGAFERAGKLRALRVPEVALAAHSRVARVFIPKTGFVHLETAEGVLDIIRYEEEGEAIRLPLGLGIRFSMTRALRTRVRTLSWRDRSYLAAPPEFMFLTKAVGYLDAQRAGKGPECRTTKHFADLVRMAPMMDWGFARELLGSLRLEAGHAPLPRPFQRRLNPYAPLDLEALRGSLSALAESEPR